MDYRKRQVIYNSTIGYGPHRTITALLILPMRNRLFLIEETFTMQEKNNGIIKDTRFLIAIVILTALVGFLISNYPTFSL